MRPTCSVASSSPQPRPPPRRLRASSRSRRYTPRMHNMCTPLHTPRKRHCTRRCTRYCTRRCTRRCTRHCTYRANATAHDTAHAAAQVPGYFVRLLRGPDGLSAERRLQLLSFCTGCGPHGQSARPRLQPSTTALDYSPRQGPSSAPGGTSGCLVPPGGSPLPGGGDTGVRATTLNVTNVFTNQSHPLAPPGSEHCRRADCHRTRGSRSARCPAAATRTRWRRARAAARPARSPHAVPAAAEPTTHGSRRPRALRTAARWAPCQNHRATCPPQCSSGAPPRRGPAQRLRCVWPIQASCSSPSTPPLRSCGRCCFARSTGTPPRARAAFTPRENADAPWAATRAWTISRTEAATSYVIVHI